MLKFLKLLLLRKNLTPLHILISNICSRPNLIFEIGPVLYLHDLKKNHWPLKPENDRNIKKVKSIANLNELLMKIVIIISSEQLLCLERLYSNPIPRPKNSWAQRSIGNILKKFQNSKKRNLFH